MPRLSDRVLATERQVNATAEKGEYRICGARNLVLRVTAAGTKNWSFAYLSAAMDKWRKMSLGSWPSVSLGAAKGHYLPQPSTPGRRGNLYASHTFSPRTIIVEDDMGRGLLLWLIGIPLPIILLIWLFGGLS
jgi:hypothetical protein